MNSSETGFMLSYQHAYHAGNLADLHKHIALSGLLALLTRKTRPISYVDTHAGRGLYDLTAKEARKTGEASRGVQRLGPAGGPPPDHPFTKVLETVRRIHGDAAYPGSPLIAHTMLRPVDRLHLMELHPQEHHALTRVLASPNVSVHKRDGLAGAVTLAPFAPRRGFVLIDPSYEVKTEYQGVADCVPRLLRKWPQAVIMIWYPLLGADRHRELTGPLEASGLSALQRDEYVFGPGFPGRMRGSGLLLVNGPYGADAVLGKALHACLPS